MKATQLDRAIAALEVEQAAILRAIELLKIQRTAQSTMTRVTRLVDRSAS